MKKQFLSLIAAGLMLGGASQLQAMDSNVYYQAARNSGGIQLNQTDERRAILANTDQRDGRPVVSISLQLRGEPRSVNIRPIHQTTVLTTAPLVKPRENEPVADYLVRFEGQRTILLHKYASRILQFEQATTREESINDQ